MCIRDRSSGASVKAEDAEEGRGDDEEEDAKEEEDDEGEEESSDWDEESEDEREAAGPRFEEVGRFLWWLCEVDAPQRRAALLEGVLDLPAADGALLLSAMRSVSQESSFS